VSKIPSLQAEAWQSREAEVIAFGKAGNDDL